ncbi:MAG TPA: aspartyl protease family protein [Sphingomonas sp.]|nr:aspartyl protease family protein [Sphingomonas sp.]
MLRRLVAALLGLLALFAAAPALAKCEVKQLAELPITMVGMRPMAPVKINGQDARLIADSGAFYSVISPGAAAEYGLKPTPMPGFYMAGVGGDAALSVAKVKSLDLAGIQLHDMEFLVGGSEPGGAGVLGQNVLGFADVEYDLEHGAIRLMKSSDCYHANLAYWAGSRLFSMLTIEERSPRQPHTIATVELNGVEIRAVFDTGAATSILSLHAAARAGVKPDSPGVKDGGYEGGFGRHVTRTWIAPFASLKIGGEEIRNPKLRIGDIGGMADMLIGADFFLSHRVYVANRMRRMFFTYDGGPVFNITPRSVVDGNGAKIALPADDAAAPTDAAGFSRRGAAEMARHDLAAAIDDFGRAIALAPSEPRYFLQRAVAYARQKQKGKAEADLDAAIKLAPGNVDARLTRAGLRYEDDHAGALADLDAAAAAAPQAADERRRIANLYSGLDAFGKAIAEDDLWIKYHPDDRRLPAALNERCWDRAMLGEELAKALDDCDAAVHKTPHTATFLDSRGMVHLRRGENDKAIRDYDEALTLAPKTAWSLYGRGVAERRKGMKAKGDADIAAATAIDPKLPARAKALGIGP